MTEFIPTQTENKPKKLRPRLFATYYYTGLNDPDKDWARIGHACTAENAVRAAIMKMLLKEASHVDIYNRDGIRVAIMERRGTTIKVVASWMEE